MAKVNVVIVDATGNKEQKVGLPDDVKCGIIMVKLVEKICFLLPNPSKLQTPSIFEAVIIWMKKRLLIFPLMSS